MPLACFKPGKNADNESGLDTSASARAERQDRPSADGGRGSGSDRVPELPTNAQLSVRGRRPDTATQVHTATQEHTATQDYTALGRIATNRTTDREIKEVRDRLSGDPILRATTIDLQASCVRNVKQSTEAQRLANLLANKSVSDIRKGRKIRDPSWQEVLKKVKNQR